MEVDAFFDAASQIGILGVPAIWTFGLHAIDEHWRLSREALHVRDVFSAREHARLDRRSDGERRGARLDLVPHMTVITSFGMTAGACESAAHLRVRRIMEDRATLGGRFRERVLGEVT